MRVRILIGLAVLALGASACSSSSKSSSEPPSTASSTAPPRANLPAETLVFNGQGNDLAAYSPAPPFAKQIVDHHRDDAHPDGLDINGQICFDPRHPGRFVAGEDTLQTTTGHPGWGILQLEGSELGKLSIHEVGKLVPTYQPSNDNPENYGCGFLPDGRIITTDVGNQASGTGDGQLIVWFPPFESRSVKYCKVNVHLATGQGVLVDGNDLLFAQARPPAAGIYRYAVSDLPTSSTPSGGCDGTDATGAPMATNVKMTQFIKPGAPNSLATPSGVALGPNGKLYVASVFNGVIAEFKRDGTYIRDVLRPPAGESLGAKPYSTGTPLGLGVGPDGSIYYADIGIVVSKDGVGPGDGTGHVRRITFDANGQPRAPETMDSNLAFPDGIGIWAPSGSGVNPGV
jgi:hypothetical protein